MAVQEYERVLPYFLEDEPMSMLLKALIAKGLGVVQQVIVMIRYRWAMISPG